MNKSWIVLNLEMADFPWYDFKAKDVITDPKQAANALEKYIKR